ncbi:MAG TPA: hypothetical protein VLI91_03645, partial [Roseiarcus sp.]|nr:hypothetical protein [Roseiarcus sp.]
SLAHAPRPALEGGDVRAIPTTSARVESAPDFLIFFARNPLKGLDSEKEMKGNERFFPFISFHFLSFPFFFFR